MKVSDLIKSKFINENDEEEDGDEEKENYHVPSKQAQKFEEKYDIKLPMSFFKILSAPKHDFNDKIFFHEAEHLMKEDDDVEELPSGKKMLYVAHDGPKPQGAVTTELPYSHFNFGFLLDDLKERYKDPKMTMHYHKCDMNLICKTNIGLEEFYKKAMTIKAVDEEKFQEFITSISAI